MWLNKLKIIRNKKNISVLGNVYLLSSFIFFGIFWNSKKHWGENLFLVMWSNVTALAAVQADNCRFMYQRDMNRIQFVCLRSSQTLQGSLSCVQLDVSWMMKLWSSRWVTFDVFFFIHIHESCVSEELLPNFTHSWLNLVEWILCVCHFLSQMYWRQRAEMESLTCFWEKAGDSEPSLFPSCHAFFFLPPSSSSSPTLLFTSAEDVSALDRCLLPLV